jgi:hypothetical protein
VDGLRAFRSLGHGDKAWLRFRLSLRVASSDPVVECPDGIIAQLARTCGGYVEDCGVVSVTASSGYLHHAKRNAIDWESMIYFASERLPGSWLCYDFKHMRIRPTQYAIRSCPYRQNSCHQRNWVVEGSIDGRSWTELD